MNTKRKKENTVLFAVVYPACENYLNDFLESLNSQTDKRFDIVLASDGLRNLGLYINQFSRLNIIELPVSGTPAAVRLQGIEFIIANGYDYVVFGDSDDYFDCSRMEISRAYLQKHGIIFNDIHLVDEKGRVIENNYLSCRFDNQQMIQEEDLIDKNCIGLTNSAVHVCLLKDIQIPSDVEAVDWYLFARLHRKGFRSCFTHETATCYRQYAANFVGMKEIDAPMLLRGVKTKMNHYKHLRGCGILYEERYHQYRQLHRRLESDPLFKAEYIQFIQNQRTDHPLWWEQVCLMENMHENTINRVS